MNACRDGMENKGKAMRMNGVSFGLQTPPSSRFFQLAADHPSSQAFPLPPSPIPLLRFPSNSNWLGRERREEGLKRVQAVKPRQAAY